MLNSYDKNEGKEKEEDTHQFPYQSILLTKTIDIITYSLVTFKALIEYFFEHAPCLLCGEIHPIRIHACLPRILITSDEIRITIIIFSIYCIRAKKQGKQYTKRILPPFVIPECNICFTNVWHYIISYPDMSIDYEAAFIILGTYDMRTVKKHIIRGWKIIRNTTSFLMTFLSMTAGYAHLPEMKPGETLICYLEGLTVEVHKAVVRMGELPGFCQKSEVFVHMVYWFEKSRKPITCTLDRVLRNLHFYDTS